MEKGKHPRQLIIAVAAAILVAMATGLAFGATPAITVKVAVTGDPVPGATVAAKATVTVNDGSTVQSIKWNQVGGIAATLSDTATDTVTIALPSRTVFREELIKVLEEQPITNAQLPSSVPASTEFE